ncbi:MAG: PHP domain-containing protein [Thermoplasmata archaeon]|nr:PHP domain-containing protein [Thermoplasmata archaeon]
MRVDMHIHSIYSSDGTMEIKEILKLAKKIGLGAIAITDHNEIKGALKAREMKILPVIRGIEVSSSEGHILAYGVDCKIPRDLGIPETIERIRECGGIAVAAHPYRYWSGLGEGNVKKFQFDAIEVFNGRCKQSSNKRAKKLCEELNKPFTAGSDAHFPDEIGRAGLIVESENEEEILDMIMKKKVSVFGTSRGKLATLRYVKKAVSGWVMRGFKRI